MKKRPKETQATITKVKLTCGNCYIAISELDGEIFEVFTWVGKAGGCFACMMQSLTTSVALGIRNGVPVNEYIKHFVGQGCPSISFDDSVKYLSCVDAIGQILRDKQKELKNNG